MTFRDRRKRHAPPRQLCEMASCIARDSADEVAANEHILHLLGCSLVTYAEARKLEAMVKERMRS